MYAQMGDSAQAEACFAKILAINPEEIDFRIDLADQLLQSGKLPEAEEQLLAYLKERPRDSAVRVSLGQLYEAMKMTDEAQAAYNEVLAREPDNIDALTALSLLYQQTGRNADAVRLADEIVNMQSSRGSEADLNKLSDSLELYERAVNRYGSSNPDAIGRNLALLRSRLIPDEEDLGAEIAPSEKIMNDAFIPVDEETNPLNLLEDEETIEDGEMPFDELVADEEVPEIEDESLDDLVQFEEPIELPESGFGPDGGFKGDGNDGELQLGSPDSGSGSRFRRTARRESVWERRGAASAAAPSATSSSASSRTGERTGLRRRRTLCAAAPAAQTEAPQTGSAARTGKRIRGRTGNRTRRGL